MPTILNTSNEETVEQADVEAALFTEAGELTLEGNIIDDFLSQVDYGDLFEDEELFDHIEVEQNFCRLLENGSIEVVEDAEGVDEKAGIFEFNLESFDPEKLAEAIDVEDLRTMFEYYVSDIMEDDGTIAGKTRLAAAQALVEGTFKGKLKKGDMIKMRKQGKKGKHLVTRMILAMLKKGVIKRTEPGEGYKSGDYEKAAGYKKGGTPADLASYIAYKRKNKTKIQKAAKRQGLAAKAEEGGKGSGAAKKELAALEKAEKEEKEAAKAAKAKKKAPKKSTKKAAAKAKKKTSKKGLAASEERARKDGLNEEEATTAHPLVEGADLAARAIGVEPKPLNEDDKGEDKGEEDTED